MKYIGSYQFCCAIKYAIIKFMKRLAEKYLKLFKLQVTLGPLFKWIEALFELLVPLVMAKIVDVGIANSDKGYIQKMGVLLIALGVAGLAFSLTCQYMASKASQGIGTALRRDMYAHINSLSYGEIDRIGTASLITRMTSDVNALENAVAMLIRLVVRAPFLVVGAAFMAMLIDFKLSLIFVAAALVIGLVLYAVMSRSIPFYRVVQKQLDKINRIVRENLSGVRVIRAFSAQQHERKRFAQANEQYRFNTFTVGKISALLSPLTAVAANVAIAAIIWFGGKSVHIGSLTQGEVIALVNYMTQILLAMVVVASLVVTFTRASASAARVNELFDLKSSITYGAGQVQAIENSAKIEFKNVSFAYPSASGSSLEHLSFKIEAGQSVGIIGPTGSGKSTIVNLICRFYDISEGQILLDGIDIKEYSAQQLCEKIAVVPQHITLFSDTIRENVRFGRQDATDAQVIAALKAAQAYDFVKRLPQCLDTKLDQGGRNLSGGQRQRLAIARALIKGAQILILDDSASALDFATEGALFAAINNLSKDITLIKISQRVHTIEQSDLILVMDEGNLCGSGRHSELLEHSEQYREICSAQSETGAVV